MTPHWENRAGRPEGNKTERCASSPPGLPACGRGAALASALPGPGQGPPATSAAFPEEFHRLRPGARPVWGRGLLVSEDDTTRSLRLLARTLLSWRRQHPGSLGEANQPSRSDPELGPLRKPLALGCLPEETGPHVPDSPLGEPCWATFLILQDYQDLKALSPSVLETTLGGGEGERGGNRSPKKSPKTERTRQN